MKNKLIMIASFIGIPVVPYAFILCMGLLEQNGIITTKYSQIIVIVAVILLVSMIFLSYKNYRSYKCSKQIEKQLNS